MPKPKKTLYAFESWYFLDNRTLAKVYLLSLLDFFLDQPISYRRCHGEGIISRLDEVALSLGPTRVERKKNLKELVEGFGTGSLPAKDLYFHISFYNRDGLFFSIEDDLTDSFFELTEADYRQLQKYMLKKNIPADVLFRFKDMVSVKGWFGSKICYSPKNYKELKPSSPSH